MQPAGDRHPKLLEPYVPLMDVTTRTAFARAIADQSPNPDRRRLLIELAADRSEWITRIAFEALSQAPLDAGEAESIEALLTRSRGSTRSAAVTLLAGQPDANALASAERLLSSTKKPMRLGGLDLLRQLADSDRGGREPARLAAEHAAARVLSADEKALVESITSAEDDPPTLDDGLGLFDPNDLESTTAPKTRRITVTTPTLGRLLTAADEFATAYQETPVTVTTWSGTSQELYGNVRWLPFPKAGQSPDEEVLHDEWVDWWSRQKVHKHDLERALMALEEGDPYRGHHVIHDRLARKLVPRSLQIGNRRAVAVALWWRWVEHGTSESIDFLLDGFENALGAVPAKHLENPLISVGTAPHDREVDWRESSRLLTWRHTLNTALGLRPDLFSAEAGRRLWSLHSWIDRPSPTAPRFRPDLGILIRARHLGVASDADILDHLIGPRPNASRAWYGTRAQFFSLAETTRRRPTETVRDTPGLLELADRVRRRIVEVELGRGDVATAASYPGLAVRSIAGAEIVLRLLTALGRGNLVRGWSWNPQEKTGVLSHLIRVSLPADDDTPAAFAALAAEQKTTERRLLELAMYAPQWSRYVEHALGWDGLDEAIHWVHAHTKDSRWSVDTDIRELWKRRRLNARRSPLSTLSTVRSMWSGSGESSTPSAKSAGRCC